MNSRCFGRLAGLVGIVVVAASSVGLLAAEPIVVNPDGAWCWFQDERAIVHDGQLTVASITAAGDVQATTWDLENNAGSAVTLRAGFDRDDHNVPGLLLRQDGRLMAFYTRHHRETRMYYRVTAEPGNATDWGPEQSYTAGVTEEIGAEGATDVAPRFTYANPFQLSGEGGRIYNFWRGIDYNPTWSASDDGGKTWSRAANLIYYKKNDRPYVKYASNGRDTIHFAFVEAHPRRPIPTSLYHAFYRAGNLYRSDGTLIHKLSEGPVTPSEATLVYDGAASPTGKAWVWDLALDGSGNPVVAYTSHLSPDDIRYRYARWNGASWEDHAIAFAGRCLYKAEESYAGGICLDPDRTDVVYLSSNVDIQSGRPNASGHYELFRGVTGDDGNTWRWQALTADSTQDNLRPIVPAGHPDDKFVLWLRGAYHTYHEFQTQVVLLRD